MYLACSSDVAMSANVVCLGATLWEFLAFNSAEVSVCHCGSDLEAAKLDNGITFYVERGRAPGTASRRDSLQHITRY